MDAATLSANFDAREKATHELRALTVEYAGKEMPADARVTEERLLEAIADFDGRIRRGVEALKATEGVQTLVTGMGTRKADGPTEDAQLRSMELGQTLAFAPETRAVDRVTGGAAIGRTLYAQIIAQAVMRSTVMAGGATIVTTSGGEPIDFTVVTARASASIVAENGTIGESTPTSVQRSVGAYKYGYASSVSTEFIQDQAVDLVGFLVGDAGPAIGDGMGRHFLTGSGTDQPKGIVTAAPAATATWSAASGTDAEVADALIDLFYELPAPYRGASAYVVADKTAAKMRKLRDANEQFLWTASSIAGAPDRFNGQPVLTDDGMSGSKVLIADLSKYRVRMAGPLRVERSVDVKFLADQVVYRFLQRADGLLVDERAAKVLTVGV